MNLETVTIVKVCETKIWIESDFLGDRHVMAQHEGYEPFTYATFHYDYAYTSNAGTLQEATRLAVRLGATEPVEERFRSLTNPPSAEQLRLQITALQLALSRLETN